MSSKRNATDLDDESSTKISKLLAEIDNFQVQWEWENYETDEWQCYIPELNIAISEAYTNERKTIEFTVQPDKEMEILLDKMVQKNKATGWERRLRCCFKNVDNFYSWQWKDEYGHWNPYGIDKSVCLETSLQSSEETCDILINKTNYTVFLGDTDNMKQVNTTSDVSREVRRIVSDASSPNKNDSSKITISEPVEISLTDTEPKSSKSSQSKASKSSQSKRGSSSKSRRNSLEDPVKTVLIKGKAPVDPECVAKVKTAHVYCESSDIYDIMLNQTNVSNNNNKFFIIQLLQDDNKKAYSVWFRWGRVGYPGQNNLVACGPDLNNAKKIFCKKFSDKTHNEWSERIDFEKVAGKYDLVKIDYGNEKNASVKADLPTDLPDSLLDIKLQSLMRLICDLKIMEKMVIEMKYDSSKAPLGNLTKSQIKAGYSSLKVIDSCIEKNNFGSKLTEANNNFYTQIPHDFGYSRPPIIRTKEELRQKIRLLEALADIELAMKIINDCSKDINVNPIDSHYKSLKCQLTPMNNSTEDYKIINEYLQNTHASTHNQYGMKIRDIYSIDRNGENNKFKDVGNRMLLWHGSRLTNWVGILSQGLRVAPPEAPVTGYMFGKGIYFADISSKSANYCFATRTNKVGLVLLCEVALGKMNELLGADYNADKLPDGCHSVKGCGKTAPDPSHTVTMNDGVLVPLGKNKKANIQNAGSYTLNYNEYVVYNTQQVKMRYLVEVEFAFK